MITEAHALDVARAALANVEQRVGVPLTVFDGQFGIAPIVDHGDVWVVHWNSVEYLATGDFRVQQLVGPIAVPKDGDEFLFLPTYAPTEQVLRDWREHRATGDGNRREPGGGGR